MNQKRKAKANPALSRIPHGLLLVLREGECGVASSMGAYGDEWVLRWKTCSSSSKNGESNASLNTRIIRTRWIISKKDTLREHMAKGAGFLASQEQEENPEPKDYGVMEIGWNQKNNFRESGRSSCSR